jgi:hypothetical protein
MDNLKSMIIWQDVNKIKELKEGTNIILALEDGSFCLGRVMLSEPRTWSGYGWKKVNKIMYFADQPDHPIDLM